MVDRCEQRPSEDGSPSAGRSEPKRLEWNALQPGRQYRSLLSMVGGVEGTVADSLAHVMERAAHALPVADGVCVAVEGLDGRRRRVATADVVAELDDLQEDLREGPCVEAVARRRPVVSADLLSDPSWPSLAASLGEGTVHSVLVVPLLAPYGVIGTLAMYAFVRSAFDDRSRQLGVRLAASAAQTVRHALVLERVRRLTFQWHLGSPDRVPIRRAIAVLMEENGVGRDEAYAVLQLLGRTEHDDLVAVARAIVAAEEGRPPAPAASGDVRPPVSPTG